MKSPIQTADGVEGAKSLAVLQGWTAALLSGRAPMEHNNYWAPDAVVLVPKWLPYGGDYGMDRIMEYGMAMMSTWDVKPSAPDLYGCGDKVFLRGRWTGTAKKTGKAVDMALLEIFTVRDGKIVHDEFFFEDSAALLAALEA
jgi:ketosteroid isomerase-like protein